VIRKICLETQKKRIEIRGPLALVGRGVCELAPKKLLGNE